MEASARSNHGSRSASFKCSMIGVVNRSEWPKSNPACNNVSNMDGRNRSSEKSIFSIAPGMKSRNGKAIVERAEDNQLARSEHRNRRFTVDMPLKPSMEGARDCKLQNEHCKLVNAGIEGRTVHGDGHFKLIIYRMLGQRQGKSIDSSSLAPIPLFNHQFALFNLQSPLACSSRSRIASH